VVRAEAQVRAQTALRLGVAANKLRADRILREAAIVGSVRLIWLFGIVDTTMRYVRAAHPHRFKSVR
jgi:hypothetical protein